MGPFFWAMSITTQLFVTESEACAPVCPPKPFAGRAPSALANKLQPRKFNSVCVSRWLFIVFVFDPRAPAGAAEAGDAVPMCPGRRAGRLAPSFRSAVSPPTHCALRKRNSTPSLTSFCSFRTTGLPERRLECKKKISVRAPSNRLRARCLSPLAVSVRDGSEDGPEGSHPCCRKFQSLKASDIGNAWPGGIHMTSTESVPEPVPCGAGQSASPQPLRPVQLALPFSWPPLACSSQGPAIPKIPPASVAWQPLGRCRERGCVFPAIDAEGRCRSHQRQWREPVFYSSHQPSSALIEQGRFGPARLDYPGDPKGSYSSDRRRMAAEREDFLVEHT
jgi:hypothetical protein